MYCLFSIINDRSSLIDRNGPIIDCRHDVSNIASRHDGSGVGSHDGFGLGSKVLWLAVRIASKRLAEAWKKFSRRLDEVQKH